MIRYGVKRSSSGASLALICLVSLSLGSCGGTVQERLGVGSKAPDEFQVVRRAPLVLPPDYNLRPPGQVQGATRRSTSDDAREIITGTQAAPMEAPSAGEQALLDAVEIEAEPEIRAKLLDENTELTQLDESRFLFILDWQRDSMIYRDDVLDPNEEAQRLVTEGTAQRVTTRRISSEIIRAPEGG